MKKLFCLFLLGSLVWNCASDSETAFPTVSQNDLRNNTLTSQDIANINRALSGALTDSDALVNGYTTGLTTSMDRQIPCPIAGFISTSGEVTVDEETHEFSGQLDVGLSDPLNPADDCEIESDIVLEGSLVMAVSGGARNGVTMTLDGTLGINRRGFGGRLYPVYPDCLIDMTYVSGDGVSGSICGEAI